MSPRAEPPLARLRRVIIPGTTGGVYTLIPGVIGFLTVLVLYVDSYRTGKPMPDVTGELLTASVTMLGVHTLRGISADRANAANGVAPVPVDPTDPTLSGEGLLSLRPRDP